MSIIPNHTKLAMLHRAIDRNRDDARLALALAWLGRQRLDPTIQSRLAAIRVGGYTAADAFLSNGGIHLGVHSLVGSGCRIHRHPDGGPITIEAHAHLYGDTIIETGHGATVRIGAGSHIQPGCHIHAFVQPIHIGSQVEIAAQCAFYSYNHGVAPERLIMDQPLTSKGSIYIGDGAWLGHGVIVLENVRIGLGAVVGAGSVVTHDIPDHAIAAGVPAKVLRSRLSPP